MSTMTGGRAARPRPHIALLLALALAALLLVAAGCGGDDEGSSGAGAGASTSANLNEAQKLLQQYETRPTQINQDQPIDKPIPAGKKIAFISCGPASCLEFGKILEPAAKTLGWSTQIITTDGSPEKMQNAIESAIRTHADAIYLPATDSNALGASIEKARKAGIVFAACCSLATAPPLSGPDKGDDVDYNVSTPKQNGPIGDALAAKVVADSKGDANALYVNISAFQILAEVGNRFESKYKELCPDCKLDELEVPLTALGKDVPDRVISKLRSNPDINYLVLSEASALYPGLSAAMKAAGLADKVKIVGRGGDSTVYEGVKSGDIKALVPPEHYSYDYAILDALARKWAGVPVQETEPNVWMVTPDTIPDTGGAAVFPSVEDYQQQWAALWGKS